MYQLTACVVLVICHCQYIASELADEKEVESLVIIAVLPLTGKVGYLGQQAKLDIEDVVHKINFNSSILQGYRLTFEWVDSQVS